MGGGKLSTATKKKETSFIGGGKCSEMGKTKLVIGKRNYEIQNLSRKWGRNLVSAYQGKRGISTTKGVLTCTRKQNSVPWTSFLNPEKGKTDSAR